MKQTITITITAVLTIVLPQCHSWVAARGQISTLSFHRPRRCRLRPTLLPQLQEKLLLRDGHQPRHVVLIHRAGIVGHVGLEMVDSFSLILFNSLAATTGTTGIVQLAPDHHPVVRPRSRFFRIKAPQRCRLTVPPELRLPPLCRNRPMHPAELARERLTTHLILAHFHTPFRVPNGLQVLQVLLFVCNARD